jgi:opacity protein-like surface antigen
MSHRLVRSLVHSSVLAIGVSAVAQAQSPRPVTVGIAVGATMPLSDFANDTKTGYHGAAILQYEPAGGIWGVRGEASYHRSDFTEEALGDIGAGPDDELDNSITHVGIAAVLLGSGRDRGFTPYALGGLGYYRVTVSASSGSLSISDSESGFGFNGGAGIRFGRQAGLFIEARYHQFSITAEDDDDPSGSDVKSTFRMIPVSIGVRF